VVRDIDASTRCIHQRALALAQAPVHRHFVAIDLDTRLHALQAIDDNDVAALLAGTKTVPVSGRP
jgi:hypothetical protein